MNWLAKILEGLGTPDDQGRDWYGWCTNQMAHAFLGVAFVLLLGKAGVVLALLAALIKEACDLLKQGFAWKNLRDSFTDISFWMMGAFLVFAEHYRLMVMLAVVLALAIGIIPRIRKAEQ